ncbi:Uu.00g133460.m01.CDS01 [Anthostomella pinea]|uniref:Uu.00g133460.m01.CDS01 n=1 Tax=Anthostomella pinea TaxID=933095 RepID=A0AAI8VPY3_9PEZI|nr:Uu.00g133460.m01.CDS01 [Anthostomella pinea]
MHVSTLILVSGLAIFGNGASHPNIEPAIGARHDSSSSESDQKCPKSAIQKRSTIERRHLWVGKCYPGNICRVQVDEVFG